MGRVRVSIAPVLRSRESSRAARAFAGGPLRFNEVLIGRPGEEELLPVEAAEALWPTARAAIFALEKPYAGPFSRGPLVLGHDAPFSAGAEARIDILRTAEGDAETRVGRLSDALETQRMRDTSARILLLDPGPVFEAGGAAMAALPRLLHLGVPLLADLRGAPLGALGAAAAMCLDLGAMLLQADDPQTAAAARDLWRAWRSPAPVCASVA